MSEASANSILSQLDRELWIVTSQHGNRRGGLIATFVSSASIVPELPRVLVGLAKHHHTCKLIESSNAFALHLLHEGQVDWVWRFGAQSGQDIDKLQGISTIPGPSGSPRLGDAPAWLDCRVETRMDIGDRFVYVAEVIAAETSSKLEPLTMRRLLRSAPAEKLALLKSQLEQDSKVDAQAIRAFRRSAHP